MKIEKIPKEMLSLLSRQELIEYFLKVQDMFFVSLETLQEVKDELDLLIK
jgi:hypothetical protein